MYILQNIFYYKITIKSNPYICSKFEVDITKIEVLMRFCLGVMPKMT